MPDTLIDAAARISFEFQNVGELDNVAAKMNHMAAASGVKLRTSLNRLALQFDQVLKSAKVLPSHFGSFSKQLNSVAAKGTVSSQVLRQMATVGDELASQTSGPVQAALVSLRNQLSQNAGAVEDYSARLTDNLRTGLGSLTEFSKALFGIQLPQGLFEGREELFKQWIEDSVLLTEHLSRLSRLGAQPVAKDIDKLVASMQKGSTIEQVMGANTQQLIEPLLKLKAEFLAGQREIQRMSAQGLVPLISNLEKVAASYTVLPPQVDAFVSKLHSTKDWSARSVRSLVEMARAAMESARSMSPELSGALDTVSKGLSKILTKASDTERAYTRMGIVQEGQMERSKKEAQALLTVQSVAHGLMLGYGALRGSVLQLMFSLIFLRFSIDKLTLMVGVSTVIIGTLVKVFLGLIKVAKNAGRTLTDTAASLARFSTGVAQATRATISMYLAAARWGLTAEEVGKAVAVLSDQSLRTSENMAAIAVVAKSTGTELSQVANDFVSSVKDGQAAMVGLSNSEKKLLDMQLVTMTQEQRAAVWRELADKKHAAASKANQNTFKALSTSILEAGRAISMILLGPLTQIIGLPVLEFFREFLLTIGSTLAVVAKAVGTFEGLKDIVETLGAIFRVFGKILGAGIADAIAPLVAVFGGLLRVIGVLIRPVKWLLTLFDDLLNKVPWLANVIGVLLVPYIIAATVATARWALTLSLALIPMLRQVIADLVLSAAILISKVIPATAIAAFEVKALAVSQAIFSKGVIFGTRVLLASYIPALKKAVVATIALNGATASAVKLIRTLAASLFLIAKAIALPLALVAVLIWPLVELFRMLGDIVHNVRAKFFGLNEAMRPTRDWLSDLVKDLKVVVHWMGWSPGLGATTERLVNFFKRRAIPSFRDLWQSMKYIASGAKGVSGALKEAFGIQLPKIELPNFPNAISLVVDIVSTAISTTTSAIKDLISLGGSVITLTIEVLSTAVTTAMTLVKELVAFSGRVVSITVTVLGNALEAGAELIKIGLGLVPKIVNWTINIIGNALERGRELVNITTGLVVSTITRTVNFVLGEGRELWEAGERALLRVVNFAFGLNRELWDFMVIGLKRIVNFVIGIGRGLWETMTLVLERTVNFLLGFGRNLIEAVGTTVERVVNFVIGVGEDLWSLGYRVLNVGVSFAEVVGKGIGDIIVSTGKSIASLVVEGFSIPVKFVEKVLGLTPEGKLTIEGVEFGAAFQDALKGTEGFLENIRLGIENAGLWLENINNVALPEIKTGIVGAVANLQSAIVGAISSASSSIVTAISGIRLQVVQVTLPPSLPTVPSYQHGGIVPGPIGMPQLAVVHGGEEYLGRRGGSPAVYVNVSGNYIMNDSVARTLGEKVAEQVSKSMRRHRGVTTVW